MAENVTIDTVELECRHCASKNRIPVDRALEDLSLIKCGRCTGTLLRVNGEPLIGIDFDQLVHPFDRQALEVLKKIPLLDTVVKTVMGGTFDRFTRYSLMGNTVNVTERQAPRLWRLYLEAAGRIDVDPPPLFIAMNPMPNAFASGVKDHSIAVTSGLLDLMDDKEILGVLGHELTHVRLGHVLYRTIAMIVIQGGLALLSKILPIGGLVIRPLQMALARWSQMAELSADRGELLTTGSLKTAIRTHMLMAGGSRKFVDGLNEEEFIAQADEAERLRNDELLVWAFDMLTTSKTSHPFPVWRVHHAMKFAKSPEFFQLLAGSHQPALGA